MLAQQLTNGLVLGAAYALFALGFTLMFGVLRVINLAYGFYFSAGAFLALHASQDLGASIFLAFLLGAVGAGLLAVVIDGLLLTPLRRRNASELTSLIVTIGAVLFFYATATAFYGTGIRRFPAGVIPAEALTIGNVRVTVAQIAILATVALFIVLLWALMRFTRVGLSLRAVAENGDAARLMGIDVDRAFALASFLSAAMGGAAGVLIGLNFNAIQPYMGEQMMLRGFAVIIIGGLGDARGAVLAGLALGVIEVMTAGYVASSAKEAVGFAALVLTLWFRPMGLFGRAPARRA